MSTSRSPSKSISPSHFPFLLLPPELRHLIYTHFLSLPSRTSPLLRTSSLLYREFHPLYLRALTYGVQIDQDGPWYLHSPDITRRSSPHGCPANREEVADEAIRDMRRWRIRVCLAPVPRNLEQDWEVRDRLLLRGLRVEDKAAIRRAYARDSVANLAMWVRDWGTRVQEAGLLFEELEISISNCDLVDLGAETWDLLEGVRDCRTKRCKVRIEGGDQDAEILALNKRYAEGVERALMRGEAERESNKNVLLRREVGIFARVIWTATEFFDCGFCEGRAAKRKAQAAILWVDGAAQDAPLSELVQHLAKAQKLVSRHARRERKWHEWTSEGREMFRRSRVVEQRGDWFLIRLEFRRWWPGKAPNFGDWKTMSQVEEDGGWQEHVMKG
ncbi:MAG: hypothetical protein Q9219_001410 [cf. Caloplaca sp. 3 TL-2023]